MWKTLSPTRISKKKIYFSNYCRGSNFAESYQSFAFSATLEASDDIHKNALPIQWFGHKMQTQTRRINDSSKAKGIALSLQGFHVDKLKQPPDHATFSFHGINTIRTHSHPCCTFDITTILFSQQITS